MATLRMTVTVDYPAKPGSYGTTDPVKMAQIDQEQLPDDPDVIAHLMELHGFTVAVTPAEDGS